MNLESVEQEFDSWFRSDNYKQIVEEARRFIESNSLSSDRDYEQESIFLVIHFKLCMAQLILGNFTEAISVAKNGYYLSFGLVQKIASDESSESCNSNKANATKLLAITKMIQFKRILAECYCLDSDFDNAEKLISEAMKETEDSFNDANEEQFKNSDDVYFSLQVANYITYSELHRYLVRFDQAEEYSRRALNFSKRIESKSQSIKTEARSSLVESLRFQMKFSEALELAELNLKDSEKHFDKSSLTYMKSKLSLGSIYLFLGQYQEAQKYLLDVLSFAIAFDNKQLFVEMGDLKYYLAVLKWKQKKTDEALTLFREALEFYYRLYKRDHPAMIDCISDFTILLRELNRNKEANQYQSRKESILTGPRI